MTQRIDNLKLQAAVFFLTAAAFSTIYLTQPVLPVLAHEFAANPFEVSLTVSAVILGIAISIVPIGALADRMPVHKILLLGGITVAACSLVAASAHDLRTLVAVRFIQGLFIPTLTTCLVVCLARSLPAQRLNIVMGSYVSATVTGGLGGRLISGWLHSPHHWRHAFVTAAALLLIATLIAARRLREPAPAAHHSASSLSIRAMILRADLLRLFSVAYASFFVFASVFNFLPFYLTSEPLSVPIKYVTALYLTYVIGIIIGPLAGSVSDRIGSGLTMAGGALLLVLALLLSLLPSVVAISLALGAVCAGYFAVHASAVGALNSRLNSGRGRANALYVLFYYVGGFSGITLSGFAYSKGGWPAVVAGCVMVLLIPVACGLIEHRRPCS